MATLSDLLGFVFGPGEERPSLSSGGALARKKLFGKNNPNKFEGADVFQFLASMATDPTVIAGAMIPGAIAGGGRLANKLVGRQIGAKIAGREALERGIGGLAGLLERSPRGAGELTEDAFGRAADSLGRRVRVSGGEQIADAIVGRQFEDVPVGGSRAAMVHPSVSMTPNVGPGLQFQLAGEQASGVGHIPGMQEFGYGDSAGRRVFRLLGFDVGNQMGMRLDPAGRPAAMQAAAESGGMPAKFGTTVTEDKVLDLTKTYRLHQGRTGAEILQQVEEEAKWDALKQKKIAPQYTETSGGERRFTGGKVLDTPSGPIDDPLSRHFPQSASPDIPLNKQMNEPGQVPLDPASAARGKAFRGIEGLREKFVSDSIDDDQLRRVLMKTPQQGGVDAPTLRVLVEEMLDSPAGKGVRKRVGEVDIDTMPPSVGSRKLPSSADVTRESFERRVRPKGKKVKGKLRSKKEQSLRGLRGLQNGEWKLLDETERAQYVRHALKGVTAGTGKSKASRIRDVMMDEFVPEEQLAKRAGATVNSLSDIKGATSMDVVSELEYGKRAGRAPARLLEPSDALAKSSDDNLSRLASTFKKAADEVGSEKRVVDDLKTYLGMDRGQRAALTSAMNDKPNLRALTTDANLEEILQTIDAQEKLAVATKGRLRDTKQPVQQLWRKFNFVRYLDPVEQKRVVELVKNLDKRAGAKVETIVAESQRIREASPLGGLRTVVPTKTSRSTLPPTRSSKMNKAEMADLLVRNRQRTAATIEQYSSTVKRLAETDRAAQRAITGRLAQDRLKSMGFRGVKAGNEVTLFDPKDLVSPHIGMRENAPAAAYLPLVGATGASGVRQSRDRRDRGGRGPTLIEALQRQSV